MSFAADILARCAHFDLPEWRRPGERGLLDNTTAKWDTTLNTSKVSSRGI